MDWTVFPSPPVSQIHMLKPLPPMWLRYPMRIRPFSSVTQSFPTLCNPMDCSTPGLPVHHQLPEFTQTHVKSVMPSKHLILCHPLLLPPSIFPSIRVLSNESVLRSGGQSIGVSALASVLPMNIQDWFPLAWTGWISLQSKGLKSFLQHHSSKTSILRHSAFFIVQLSHPYMTIGKAIELMSRTFVGNASAF